MDNVALSLADKFKSVGVSTVYGEVTDVDGVKIVPVAVAGFGFGAGEGNAESDMKGEHAAGGTGGGGGGLSIPVGAYVRSEHGVRFEPNVVCLMAVGVPLVCATGRLLKMVIRALKK